jgi:hypothetical protein
MQNRTRNDSNAKATVLPSASADTSAISRPIVTHASALQSQERNVQRTSTDAGT